KESLIINTSRGILRYLCLPFGVKSAPGIFQSLSNVAADINGAIAYVDDVVVTGRTRAEHD
ncbi:unnamed protein product, partial [Cylicostephanus goldi]